jgi:predicted nucleotide-binding protein
VAAGLIYTAQFRSDTFNRKWATMNLIPKVFIGSSAESAHIADAIDSGLRPQAEPTVWKTGTFNLSQNFLQDLVREARNSDFGIFVFSGDDIAQIRGQNFRVPRDNVVLELGLFSGILGSSRCFFVVSNDFPVRLPSDLQGITCHKYSRRSDGNWTAEMNSFCSIVKKRMEESGFWLYGNENYIMDLSTQYECCDWILDEDTRVRRKDEIFERMRAHIKGNYDSASKLMLLKQGRTGCYVAFAAAVSVNSQSDDAHLIIGINPNRVSAANAQHKMIEAISAIIGKLSDHSGKNELLRWASDMPISNDTVKKQLNQLR